MARSPYLKGWRLADVIAALSVMGHYTYSSRPAKDWADRLDAPRSAVTWRQVFDEHPEIFRVSNEPEGWASLRLRHGFDRTYSVVHRRELSFEELSQIGPESDAYKDLTRRPLTPDEIESLTQIAISLHARAIAHEGERRWLTPLLFALLGTVLGVVLQAALR